MSVFVTGSVPNTPPQAKCRKKYETKYSTKYETEYEWVGPSAKGLTYAQCRWCLVDICIKSVGAKGLRNHETTGRHKQKATSQPSPPPQPPQTSSQLTNAVYPVLEVEGVVEHDIDDMADSPRPVTPQTPNTPLSPSEDPMQPSSPPPPLLDFTTSLPVAHDTLHHDTSALHQDTSTLHQESTTLPPAASAITQASSPQTQCLVASQPKGVEESLIIEYDNPDSCDDPLATKPRETVGSSTKKVSSEDKYGLSTDDLTCNVCGKVYVQWTSLKKHLMDHILHAQNSAEGKSKTGGRERGKAGRGRSVSRAARTTQPPSSHLKESVDEKSGAGGSGAARRRGRGRGVQSRVGRGAAKKTPPQPRSITQHKHQPHHDDSTHTNTQEWEHHRTTQGHPVLTSVKDSIELDTEECDEDSIDDCAEMSGSEVKPGDTGKRKPGPLQCRVCRVLFYSRQELKEHQDCDHNHGRPYQCQECHKYFTTQNHLEVHVRHKHSLGPNPRQCSICNKTLSSRTNLRIHMRIHKGERPFECQVCHKTFNRKANMEMHLVYHTGERRFTCEICGHSFFAINALKRHNKLHTGERDYACDICGATYVTGTDLRRHRLKHSQVKPFPCHLCQKQFTRSHDLKVHLRYHNKELRYTCDICNKQFVESGNYKRHMRRHTGERPYICNICSSTFSQVHHLKTHLRTSHVGETGGVEEGDGGRMRAQSHRILRLQPKRTPKSEHSPKLLSALTHTSQPQPHLAPHPQGIGSVCQNNSQTNPHTDQSPPMAHSTTTAGPSGHTTQITGGGGGGMNHTSFIHGYPAHTPHIYNHSVMPHYPTLFDACQGQNTGNHIQMH